MSGTLVNLEKAGLTTLYEFAMQARMEAEEKGEDSVYSLRDEAISVKHTLSTFHHVVEKRIKEYNSIQEMLERVEKSELPDEQKKKNKSELEKLEQSRISRLMAIQEQMREAVTQVARIVKMAAEVEATKATRFDSLQLLQLLQQIPILLTELLSKKLGQVFSELVDDILLAAASDNAESEWPNNQLVNKVSEIREHAVNELVLSITSELSDQINGLKVAYNRDTFGGDTGDKTGQALAVDPAEIIRKQVQEMVNAVPDGPE